MLSDISRELTTLLEADYGEDVREAIKDALSKINNNSIPAVEVTGIKGDAESEYRKGDVNISKANIGLDNVDNTSDANKPISNSAQIALNKKIGLENLKGAKTYRSNSGFFVSFENTYKDVINEFVLYGKSVKSNTSILSDPPEIISAGDSGSIDIVVSSRNLLKLTPTTVTSNGVSFTVNNDGTVIANRTNDSTNDSTIKIQFRLPNGKYVASGCPSGGDDNTFHIYMYASGQNRRLRSWNGINQSLNDNGESTQFMIDDEDISPVMYIRVRKGISVNNLVFKPMIVTAEDEGAPFEPCVSVVSSISTPNGLLGIPVNSGGNYTDKNNQQWICDTIDKSSGKLIKRCDKIQSYNGESLPGAWISNMDEYVEGNSPTNGSVVIYALANPIEQNLNSDQLAALDKLYSFDGKASIYSTDSVEIEMKADVSIIKPESITDSDAVYFKMAEESNISVVHINETDIAIRAEENTRYICGEVSTLEFTPATKGLSDIIFTSGSSKTILTLPNTVKMPDWFEVEANMTYEISIADGVYGVVTSWAVRT